MGSDKIPLSQQMEMMLPESGTTLTFEDVLKKTGSMGLWQGITIFFVAYSQFWMALIHLAYVFFALQPPFMCDVPELAHLPFNQAQMLSLNLTNTEIMACNYSYRFDATIDMRVTIVTQWSLVCDRKLWPEQSQTVYFIGYLAGSLCGGLISDRFGRQKSFVLFTVILSVLGVVQGLMPSYATFLIVRFLTAFTKIASSLAGFCLVMEMLTSGWRDLVGGLFFIPYAAGYTSLSLAAYLLRDWRELQMAVSAPCLLVIFAIWLTPESPRWLLSKGRTEAAEKVLRRGARLNRRRLPPQLHLNQVSQTIKKETQTDGSKKSSFFEIFRYPTITLRTLNLFMIWFTVTFAYYGVSLSIDQFAGNRFVNNAIAGAVEFPAYIITVGLLRWGRKRGQALTFLLAGAALIGTAFLAPGPWRLGLAMVGKLAISIAFAIVYVFTMELFPTPVRNSGLAACSAVSRIGSAIAPLVNGIAKSGSAYRWIPVAVFGGLSVLAFVLTLLLPETKNRRLPDTFEDAAHLKRDKRLLDQREAMSDCT